MSGLGHYVSSPSPADSGGSVDEIESPDWHGQILEERRKRIKAGDAEFVSIAELKKSAGRR
jgi:hypothetical protein